MTSVHSPNVVHRHVAILNTMIFILDTRKTQFDWYLKVEEHTS